jgi:Domain of unknown function (DUF5134)
MTPSWLLDLLAAIMLAIAAASAARLAAVRLATVTPVLAGGRWRPMQAAADADMAHVLMGIAMAGMFAPGLATLPNAAWGAVFGLAAAWFAGRVWSQARRDGIRGPLTSRCMLHLIHSAAMFYMFLAFSSPGAGGMAGMSPAGTAMGTLRYPTLAGLFALLLIGYSVWDLDQLSGKRFSPAVAGGPVSEGPVSEGPASGRDAAARAFLLAPGNQAVWEVVLGVAMALMLVIII